MINTNFLKVIPILALCILYSCNNSTINSPNSLLLNCWTDSFEELEDNGPDIYRPCDYKEFPKARYRNIFTLNEDWTCEFWVLAPNDGHYFIEGTWEMDELTNTITLFDSIGQILLRREIIEIDEDIIKLN